MADDIYAELVTDDMETFKQLYGRSFLIQLTLDELAALREGTRTLSDLTLVPVHTVTKTFTVYRTMDTERMFRRKKAPLAVPHPRDEQPD